MSNIYFVPFYFLIYILLEGKHLTFLITLLIYENSHMKFGIACETHSSCTWVCLLAKYCWNKNQWSLRDEGSSSQWSALILPHPHRMELRVDEDTVKKPWTNGGREVCIRPLLFLRSQSWNSEWMKTLWQNQ